MERVIEALSKSRLKMWIVLAFRANGRFRNKDRRVGRAH